MTRGEVLVDAGQNTVPLFVVLSGEIEVLMPSATGDQVIVAHGPGQFSGEGNMLTGRRSLGQLRVSRDGEVVELGRDQVLRLVQTDAELSEILMRAFILRRNELISGDFGDVVVIGSTTLRRHPSREGVPDTQRPPASLHRSRSRRRRPGAARPVSGQRGRRAGVDLPRDDGAA